MSQVRPGSTAKRSVSFGLSDSVVTGTSDADDSCGVIRNSSAGDFASPSGNASITTTTTNTSTNSPVPSSQATPSSALKPALKPGTDRKRLPPPEQYQHPDALLRRLRLVDSRGNPINLRQTFRDAKVIGFYFASQWAGQPLKEYHSAISTFCRHHPHEFKAIYVSVDVDEQWYKAGVKDKPWVSMVWNDGSSMPTERSAQLEDELPKLYNNEDFLLANETDIDESLSHTDKSGEAYLRPFSRVHLAAKLNIIAAPTLCIYHLPSGKMLEGNVRISRLSSPASAEETWDNWKNGEKSASFGVYDAFQIAPYTFIAVAFAILFFLFVKVMGDEYNIIKIMFQKVLENSPHNRFAILPQEL